jgi:hypothetical protein
MTTTDFIILLSFSFAIFMLILYVKYKYKTTLEKSDRVVFVTNRPELGQNGEIDTDALNFPHHSRILRLPLTRIHKIIYKRKGVIIGEYAKHQYKEMREEILRLNNKKLTQWPTKI